MVFIACVQNKHIQLSSMTQESPPGSFTDLLAAVRISVRVDGCNQATYHWIRREKGSGDSVDVFESELDACVGEAKLVDVGGGVTGADVALSRKRGHGDGVF